MTPRRGLEIQHDLAARGAALTGQPVDPAAEHFIVYVPQQPPPPRGYALVVFVPPWPEASMPNGWEPVFERLGIIYASFAHAGNDQGVQFRRIPLAVLAAADVARQYPVDPSRIYVAGFSGGARVALRAALAYPDVFSGALLLSGSDPIGSAEIPLPPRELFLKFQQSTRLVYMNGQHDEWALRQASASLASMHDWCVYTVDSQTMAMKAHELPESSVLARALERLQVPANPPADKLAACRAGVEGALARRFDEVAALASAGKDAESLERLDALDERYGGLPRRAVSRCPHPERSGGATAASRRRPPGHRRVSAATSSAAGSAAGPRRCPARAR